MQPPFLLILTAPFPTTNNFQCFHPPFPFRQFTLVGFYLFKSLSSMQLFISFLLNVKGFFLIDKIE